MSDRKLTLKVPILPLPQMNYIVISTYEFKGLTEYYWTLPLTYEQLPMALMCRIHLNPIIIPICRN